MKIVRLAALSIWPPLLPRRYPWYSFLLVTESTPVSYIGRKDSVNEKFPWFDLESKPDHQTSYTDLLFRIYSTLKQILRLLPNNYIAAADISFCLLNQIQEIFISKICNLLLFFSIKVIISINPGQRLYKTSQNNGKVRINRTFL
jgi:hypothetical protein